MRDQKKDNPIKALENELEELFDCDLVVLDTFSAFFLFLDLEIKTTKTMFNLFLMF